MEMIELVRKSGVISGGRVTAVRPQHIMLSIFGYYAMLQCSNEQYIMLLTL